MSAHRDRSHLMVSLFPFLSVLVCVTGTLSFMVAAVSVISITDMQQVVDPTSTGLHVEPRFAECRKDGVAIHPADALVPLSEIDLPDNAFQALLDEIAGRKDALCLILLVRPDGLPAFQRARARALAMGIEVGYEAVYAAGPIELRGQTVGSGGG